MSGHIELCGAPGVGKSTLVAALAGRRVATPDGTATIVPAQVLSAGPRALLRPLGSVLRSATIVGALSSRPGLARVATRALTADALAAMAPLAPGEVTGLLAGLPSPSTADPRSDAHYRDAAIGWLEDMVRLLRLAERLGPGLVAALDEGVVQRCVSLLGASASVEDQTRLLMRLPRPGVVVHLVADLRLVEGRAAERHRAGRAPRLHAGRDVDAAVELLLADARAIGRAASAIASIGVLVLDVQVGATEAVDALAGRVVRSIDEAVMRSRD